jgi:hypothetical protein
MKLVRISERFALQSLHNYWRVRETALNEEGKAYAKPVKTYASLKQACEKLLELEPDLCISTVKEAVRASNFAQEKEFNF